ncbi:MAG: hypothetical protein MK078_00765 [Crocinitomicaceae bacterium]|nr:hypothetical protein [Crocinitomicaceae bacterium]
MEELISSVSIINLILLISAHLFESIVLVPHWKSISVADFIDHYKGIGPRLTAFFTPITIAFILSILASVVSSDKNNPFQNEIILLITTLIFLYLIIYYKIFKRLNSEFYRGQFKPTELQGKLNKWERWHSFRVINEVIILCLLILLTRG